MGSLALNRAHALWSRLSMFFPKINVKNDPVRRWQRPDRHFFANVACQVLAYGCLS